MDVPRAFVSGFLGALAALMLSAAVWFAVLQPVETPGLVWGGSVYRSKAEFGLYLKSKGLSYSTWLKRNPGVAPWEPGRRATKPETRTDVSDWKRDALLAINAALLAMVAAAVVASRGERRRDPSRTLTAHEDSDRASPKSIRRMVAQGVAYVELGAGELTHAAIERIHARPDHRQEIKMIALAGALATATGVLITLLLN